MHFISCVCKVGALSFVVVGRCSWRSHPQLSAGEIASGPPEPRREKFPHLLPAAGGRRRRPAETTGPGEGHAALQLPATGRTDLLHVHTH